MKALLLPILYLNILFNTHGQSFHHAILDIDSRFHFYWDIQHEAQEIHIELHVRTQGWVALGLNAKGSMEGADIVIAGINDNGQVYLFDMHADNNSMPLMDSKQDYVVMFANENATHTVIGLKRKLVTCDKHDWRITNDTVRILWALDEQDAEFPNKITKHSFRDRGVRSILLTLPIVPELSQGLPTSAKPWDLTMDKVQVPGDHHTFYTCTIFKKPPGLKKHHILKYEPLIQPGHEQYVHHVVVYHCTFNMEDFVGKNEACFNADYTQFSPMYKCSSRAMWLWAIGGGPFTWSPDTLGFPIFEEGSSPYFLLEVHYDNTAYHKRITDSSGMRMWITEHLKPVEVGVLVTGMGVDANTLIIPPNAPNFKLSALCPAQCTKDYPVDGITIIGGLLHEHTAGKAMTLRHYRNGVELAPILQDNHYDFNYQEMRLAFPPRQILPNDSLVAECIWDTTQRTRPTYGGYTTTEEMCFLPVYYYPKVASFKPAACIGGPQRNTFVKAIGATKIPDNAKNEIKYESILVKVKGDMVTGPYGDNLTMQEYTWKYEWSPEAIQQFQTIIDEGDHFSLCAFHDQTHVGELLTENNETIYSNDIEKLDYKEYISKLPKPTIKYENTDHSL